MDKIYLKLDTFEEFVTTVLQTVEKELFVLIWLPFFNLVNETNSAHNGLNRLQIREYYSSATKFHHWNNYLLFS